MNPEAKATLLNPKTSKTQTGVDNSISILTPEDIAWGLAHLNKIEFPVLGSPLFRVKYGLQNQCIEEMTLMTTVLVKKHIDLKQHLQERIAQLALRETGAIKPVYPNQIWSLQQAETFTDQRNSPKCPKCNETNFYQPGKLVICANHETPYKYKYHRLTRPQRRKWIETANACSHTGMSDLAAVRTANDVIRHDRDLDLPDRFEAGPEMCFSCGGARDRIYDSKHIQCETCTNGLRVWQEEQRRKVIFGWKNREGRRAWERYSTIYRREIKGTLIQVDHDTKIAIKRAVG